MKIETVKLWATCENCTYTYGFKIDKEIALEYIELFIKCPICKKMIEALLKPEVQDNGWPL